MVVHDLPAVRCFLEDHCEQPLRCLFAHHQFPTATDQCAFGSENIDLQIVKSELAHLFAFGLVALLVALQSGLPTLGHNLAREKGQLVGLPVSSHEPFEIALVPCGDLVVEDFADSTFSAVTILSSSSGRQKKNSHSNE